MRAFSFAVAGMTLASAIGGCHGRMLPRGQPRGQPSMPETPAASNYDYNYCWGLYPTNSPCPIRNGTFDQLIDHKNPSMGTFKQRYWVNGEHYAGPGAPVLLHGPNESAADRQVWYVSNQTADGLLAQEVKGAAIVIEHRYYGDSSPYEEMTTKSMRFLTLDQSLQDLIYFAHNVDLELGGGNGTHPGNTPWIYSGGSYPGAMATWLQKLYPGTFWAYHATSAVVQPIAEYWQYYEPIEAAMPRNCSTDMKKAMRLLEAKLNTDDEEAKNKVKGRFGLAGLEDDDFGWAVITGLQNWQGTAFNTPYDDVDLYNMCDYIEGVPDRNKANDPLPGAEGVGACKALKGLARWLREVRIPGSCKGSYWEDPNSIACWDAHNTSSPLFTDRSVRNEWGLQWQWFSCNEPFQQWQASAPGDTGLLPKFLTMKDLRDQCGRFFPDEDGYKYGLRAGRTTEDIVKLTGGWDFVNTTRLLYVNGEYDPWLMETASSPRRPGGPLQSTSEVPIFVVPKAAHCPDMVMSNIMANEENHKIYNQVSSILKTWVGEFYTETGITRPGFSRH